MHVICTAERPQNITTSGPHQIQRCGCGPGTEPDEADDLRCAPHPREPRLVSSHLFVDSVESHFRTSAICRPGVLPLRELQDVPFGPRLL